MCEPIWTPWTAICAKPPQSRRSCSSCLSATFQATCSTTAKGLEVHLIWDNYATHKTPLIRNWLLERPRWHVHLTPTSASWLNQVERFFALITERKIRRGTYQSVAAVRADIASFIERHNRDPKPFKWSKSADDILQSIERYCLRNASVTGFRRMGIQDPRSTIWSSFARSH
jgi:hypothetical protein